MPHIFISYSRKDTEQANLLAEMLASAGLSCWIDRQGIDLASPWSREIVQAINECTAFLVLLSPHSIVSHNVVKEVSLASEKRKKILPLELEPIQLTEDLEYQLAGIQRAPMTNIDAIIRALSRLGVNATSVPQPPKLVRDESGKKSVMILPFEDLSPTADNAWFADGIVSELISALSSIKTLRVIDASVTKEFKSFKGSLATFAREMSIRYFVQGDVRKFGDNLKIMARLLDIETGEYLWQDSLKGTMQDVFTIQEQVAEKVLGGLHIAMSSRERHGLATRHTSSPEAYEYWLRGYDFFARFTREDFERALEMYERAVALDPRYVRAYSAIANTAHSLYRSYTRDPADFEKLSWATQKLLEVGGESAEYWQAMSLAALRTDHPQDAVHYAERAVELDPEFAIAYDTLAFAQTAAGDSAGAIRARQEVVRRRPEARTARFNVVVQMREASMDPRSSPEFAAMLEEAIGTYDRYVRLNPDDLSARAQRTYMLQVAWRTEDAREEADRLLKIPTLDAGSCFNIACVYALGEDAGAAIETLERAVARGFKNLEALSNDPDLASIRDGHSPHHDRYTALVTELTQGIGSKTV